MEKMIKTYTAADFELYYIGAMPVQERFALEKAALEDPFLADALEGYEHTTTGEADVAELKKRLFEKTKKKKSAPVYRLSQNTWWRIAALFIIIAGAGLLLYKINPSADKNSLAKNEVTNSNTAESEYALPHHDSVGLPGDIAYQDNNGKSDAAITAPGSTEADEKKENANSSVMAETSPAPRLEEAPLILSDQDAKAADGYLKGKVSGDERKIIALAPVQQRMSDVVIMKDTSVDDIVSEDKIVKKTFLQQSTQSAQSARKKIEYDSAQHDKNLSKTLSTSIPVIQSNKQLFSGNKAFDEYLVKNVQPVYDKAGLPQKGVVLLSFRINKSGEPINIKVEQSTCKACEEQAKKLLENGPDWKVENVEKKVLIRFY